MQITIKQAGYQAVIETVGAQLISFCDPAEKEYIWQRDPDYWTSCSPLLFPSVGNCRNGRTSFDGKWYSMPKHGFCREAEFKVTGCTASEATFRFTSDDRTRQHYPYEFVLTLNYRLEDGVLSILYQVTNPQDSDIYYCIGAHPGFICPMEPGASFEDYQLEFDLEETAHSMVYDLKTLQFDVSRHRVFLDHDRILPLTYDLFDDDAIFFEELRSRSVSLVHRESKKGIRVFFPDFETVAFWTPDHRQAPLLCVEPWNGSAIRSDEDDEFLHRHHLQKARPGETKQYRLRIQVV